MSTRETRYAAWLANRQHAPKQKAQAYAALVAAEREGLNGWELSEVTGIPYSSVFTPLAALRKEEAIRDSGRVRPTQTGCGGVVWVAAEFWVEPLLPPPPPKPPRLPLTDQGPGQPQ